MSKSGEGLKGGGEGSKVMWKSGELHKGGWEMAKSMHKSGDNLKGAGEMSKSASGSRSRRDSSKAAGEEVPKVVYEGWMVRIGRRKIGRSFMHMRYFVLETRLLAYYKKKPPEKDRQVPLKTLVIDGNCRVEDRGLKTHHGHMVYVICVYNKKDSGHGITMAAFNIQEALIWKAKIELVIDQQQGSLVANGDNVISSLDSALDSGRNAGSSDHESQFSPEDEEQPSLLRGTTIGNGPPDTVPDWTHDPDSGLSDSNEINRVYSRKNWRLVRCQNGLRVFEELVEVDHIPRGCTRAMKSVGVVDATCEAVFGTVMSMDATRFEWDCSFLYGSLVEEVDGHTAVLYHRLQLDWCSRFVWPRDLCYVRYWRRNDDGSYVVLFRSRVHADCGPQPGFVRAHIENGGFKISPLKSRPGRSRTQVQHLMQIDLRGWGVGYIPSVQQHFLFQMLNSVAGLREWFSQTDEVHKVPRMPIMDNMPSDSISNKNNQKHTVTDIRPSSLVDQMQSATKSSVMLEEDSDEDEDYQIPDLPVQEDCLVKPEADAKLAVSDEESSDQIDHSWFSGNLRHDNHDNSRDCWMLSDGKNFKIRGKNFLSDKSKIPGGKPIMELVAVDWLKDTKRMDHVSRRKGCAAQVTWMTYGTDPPSSVSRAIFTGWLLYRDIMQPYMPIRVLHQLGYVQPIPGAIYRPVKAIRSCGAKLYKVEHPEVVAVDSWSMFPDVSILHVSRYQVDSNDHVACDLLYISWYYRRSHPRLLNDGEPSAAVPLSRSNSEYVASEKGLFSLAINLQVPGSTWYSMVFYLVIKQLTPGSLLQRFVDGDDEFRNSRFKIIPSVPKGSWIVRQSVGSSPCLLGKAVDLTYIRGEKYLEIDVDIGSSTIANGVLGLVCGVVTTLVVDMAFLIQANTYDELPEQLLGAVRVSHIELSSAIAPELDSPE